MPRPSGLGDRRYAFEKRKSACVELIRGEDVRDERLPIGGVLDEDDQIITGGFCPRGNSETSEGLETNYVDKYHKIYEKHFKLSGHSPKGPRLCEAEGLRDNGRHQEAPRRLARRASGARPIQEAGILPGCLAEEYA